MAAEGPGLDRVGEELLAAVEAQLLGRPASMGRREVSRGAGVSMRSARRFWHAMGFQIVQDEHAMFTEADLRALRSVVEIGRSHDIDEDLALAMTRAFARTSDRLAVWQTQLVSEALAAEGIEGEAAAQETARRLATLADDIEPLLVYVWRRHLTSAISRMLADARPHDSHDHSAPVRVIGFADLVSFTALVQRLTERELARLVQRFEELASDVVTTHGGRVIKTVGDEVLFLHVDAAPACAIALDLVDAMAEDPLLPQVRVGMSLGPVLSRLGDVFGTTVNRASRLTTVTPPGQVYVDDTLAQALVSVSGFRTVPTRRRNLKGIGVIAPSELHRSAGGRGPAAHDRHP